MKTFQTFKYFSRGAASTAILLILVAVWPGRSYATEINGIYNTGVDDNGSVLPLHSLDPHYALSGAGTLALIIPTDPIWVHAPAGSAWIGPNAGDTMAPDPEGLYYYRLTFDLTGVELAGLHLAGKWATDNTGELWLNGHYTGFNKGLWGFTRLDNFLLDAGWNDGLNTLEFRVANVPPPEWDGTNPSGLLVADLVASTEAFQPTVPETGATLPLLGGTALGLMLVWSRLSRSKTTAPAR